MTFPAGVDPCCSSRADASADASLTRGFATSGVGSRSGGLLFWVPGRCGPRCHWSSLRSRDPALHLSLDRSDDTRSRSVNKHHSLVDRPASKLGPLGSELVTLAATWNECQHEMVITAAQFAESPEWVLDGSPTAAHWLATVAGVEACTAREWIRIGKALARLPVTTSAFADERLSYSQVRTLTRTATPENEAELVDLIADITAADAGKAIAAWMNRNLPPEDIDAHQRASRAVKWRTEPDGMVVFTMRGVGCRARISSSPLLGAPNHPGSLARWDDAVPGADRGERRGVDQSSDQWSDHDAEPAPVQRHRRLLRRPGAGSRPTDLGSRGLPALRKAHDAAPDRERRRVGVRGHRRRVLHRAERRVVGSRPAGSPGVARCVLRVRIASRIPGRHWPPNRRARGPECSCRSLADRHSVELMSTAHAG